MSKILFPEVYNEFIQIATSRLRDEGSCEPVIELCDLSKACHMLMNGDVDAMIAGIDHTSRDVILACKDILGFADKEPEPETDKKRTFSSLFVAELPDGRKFIVSDGATCKNPTEIQLADIVELVNDASARILEEEPRIAMLSFSSFGSGGSDPSIEKINDAISLVRSRRPEIKIDGEMQLDAAVNERIGTKKAPDSTVAGHANVLITPDINSGNILYKSIAQFAGATIAGPILLGFSKPVSDLSRGSTVEDIILTAHCLEKLI